MQTFLMRAMPWIVIALCLILGISLHLRQKADRRRHPERQQQQDSRINEGACIGMCVGVAAASVVRLNYGMALGTGALIGALIGSRIRKSGSGNQDPANRAAA